MAAHLVLQKMNNVRFVMAGSGDMLKHMIHWTASLGIFGQVSLHWIPERR